MAFPSKKLFAWVIGGFLFFLYPSKTYDRGVDASTPRLTEQTLFVALDGIPFSMVQDLYQKNKFPAFQAPSRVIATFPSTTTTGFTGLFRSLGAQKAPGYDARFFSYPLQEVRGNLLDAYDFEAADYNRYFSYNRNTGFRQVVMYTLPRFALENDLKQLKPLIWDHPEKEAIFFYVGSTDGAGHLDGPDQCRELLLEVSAFVENLRQRYRADFKRDLRVVFFSDHGFHWADLKKIDVGDFEDRLKKTGLKLSENLKDPNQVVAITWGNISGGDLYTNEALAPKVSQVLLEIPGVDLVAYRLSGNIRVEAPRSRNESAEILFDEEGKRFGYRPLEGDPLGYLPVLEALREEKKLDSREMALEKDWFEKTKDNLYPDALYRLHDAFFGLVENPAALLLSTKEDYEFGDNLTRFGASLRGGMVGTHGALSHDSSSAFIMTTDPKIQFPSVVRYDEAFLPFKKEKVF
ncbi:MAG: alkaline phosphatase family protein [bacterium]